MSPDQPTPAPPEAERLEVEIAQLRLGLGEALAELDRRRHEALDVPLQLRRHAQGVLLVALGAGVLVLGLAGGYALYARRRPLHLQRQVRRARRTAGRARKAARRAVAHPERVAGGEPHMLMKVATAGLTALASAAVKRAVERALMPRETGSAERPRLEEPSLH